MMKLNKNSNAKKNVTKPIFTCRDLPCLSEKIPEKGATNNRETFAKARSKPIFPGDKLYSMAIKRGKTKEVP